MRRMDSADRSVSVAKRSLASRRALAHAEVREPARELPSYVADHQRQAERQLARPVAELHVGIHEARKALRKARAALLLARGGLPAGARRVARRIARECRR